MSILNRASMMQSSNALCSQNSEPEHRIPRCTAILMRSGTAALSLIESFQNASTLDIPGNYDFPMLFQALIALSLSPARAAAICPKSTQAPVPNLAEYAQNCRSSFFLCESKRVASLQL